MQFQRAKNLLEVAQGWRADALDFLQKDAPKILAIIIVAIILNRLLKLITKRLDIFSRKQALPSGVRAQQLRTVASVNYSVGTFIITFVALMMILGAVGINIGPLLASAGIAGLAVGFGAQTLVKDVINGFFILLENQYDIGDAVRVGGVQGTVEFVTMRRTVLRDADGSVHNIPNSEIKIVTNLTRDWTQITLHVAVDYSESSDRVMSLLRDIAAEIKNDSRFTDDIVSEPDVPGIDRVTGNEVDYVMLVKTRPGKQFGVQRELRRRIKECFEKNGIKPGPTPLYVVGAGPGPGAAPAGAPRT
jgi:moderate conductance mechanosensitive channel